MSECTGFIDDGYSVRVKFNAVSTFYPEVEVEYRPMLKEERGRLADRTDANPKDTDQIYADVLQRHLSSWSLKRRDGTAFPINKENILKLHPLLFDRIARAVLGITPADEELDGEYTEEGSEKNSEAA